MPNTKTLVRDKSGYEFYVQLVAGRKYPDYGNCIDGDYGEFLKKVKEMELRSDDILAVGFPKSGNHWVFEFLHMMMTHRPEYTSMLRRELMMEAVSRETMDQWKEMPSPRFFFSHLDMELLPEQIVTKKPRILYIVRNVKDVAVSMYHYVHAMKKFIYYKNTWENYLDLELEGQYIYGSWFDHVRLAEDFMRNHPDVPFHIVCYEKLKSNLLEEIRKIYRFLGMPDDLAEEIAQKAEFAQMKVGTGLAKFDKYARANFDIEGHTFLRKGIVGDWRNHFTEEQSKRFDEVFEEKLKGYSIGDMLRPYMGL